MCEKLRETEEIEEFHTWKRYKWALNLSPDKYLTQTQ